jgi:hypothetical protein
MSQEYSPTPWELVPGNENHGPYITNVYGGDVCDFYAMSNPSVFSVRNGGESRPVPFVDADANAAFVVEAVNSHAALLAQVEALKAALTNLVDAEALSDVRSIVAGWNGEGRPEGAYSARRPSDLGAILPRTTCGAVYALDDAMQAARTALCSAEASKP